MGTQMVDRRWAAGAAALLALLSVPLGVPASADAATAVKISFVRYNSPGSPDRGGDRSLNGEYVVISNTSRSALAITGWRLVDVARHTYVFGSFTLGAGKAVTVHTGRGKDTTSHRYWGQRWYVWNNDKDTAYLRDAEGRLVDSCSWNDRKRETTTC